MSSDYDKRMIAAIEELNEAFIQVKVRHNLKNGEVAAVVLHHVACFAVFNDFTQEAFLDEAKAAFNRGQQDVLNTLRKEGKLN